MNKMKFFISSFFTLLVTNIIIASNPQKIVDSKIKEVTVYRQQAKVSNEATLSINAGTSEIVFQNISTQINPNSLQVAVKGDITLLSARFETNYLKRIESTPQIKNLVDSIELLKDKQSWNNEMIQMYSSEESILEVNKKLNNEKINITATDVKAYCRYV